MAVYAAWNALTGLTRTMIRLATVLMTPTGSLTVRSGVIPGGTPLLLTGSGMTGSIAPGRAIVQGTSAQGAYPAVVDAATSITVANGHASLTRIDTVWLVALDTDIDSSGSRAAQIVYQQGTAGSGSAPTAPASGTAYLRLWDITVPAGASSGTPINWGTALTDQRQYTVSVGGITPGAAAGVYAGQWRDGGGTAGILERYTGAAWEAAVRLGNAGRLELGDVALTRSAAATAQVGGSLAVTGALTGASNVNTGAGTAYTPTWTSASSPQPSLGLSTLVGRYVRVGRRIIVWGSLQIGGGATGGTGAWQFALPVPAATVAGLVWTGTAKYTNTGDNYYLGISEVASGASVLTCTVKTSTSSASAGPVTTSSPVTASGNTLLTWAIEYEAAS